MGMMTEEARWAYKSFVQAASALPGFEAKQKNDVKEYDIGKLADGYCDAFDAGDEDMKSAYASALMVRYWHMVSFLFCKYHHLPRIEVEDVVGWVWDGIARACRYRGWRDRKQSVYGKVKGPEMCINQCITSVAMMACRAANRKPRRTDFMTVSYDALGGKSPDGPDNLDKMAFMADIRDEVGEAAADLIQDIASRSVFDSMVADSIAYGKCYKVADESSDTGYKDDFGDPIIQVRRDYEFADDKLLNALQKMAKDKQSLERFANLYGLSMDSVDREAKTIAKMPKKALLEAICGAKARMFDGDAAYMALCC